MNFDDATGWLVGEPHKGMRAMFTMMNTERLGGRNPGPRPGRGRPIRGRSPMPANGCRAARLSGAKHPDKPADPMIVHPDIRRMLLTMRANVEGCRALGAWVGASAGHRRPRTRPPKRARRRRNCVALMTPVREGAVHRSRLRGDQSRHAGVGRPRLYSRQRHGAVCPRRAHRPDL